MGSDYSNRSDDPWTDEGDGHLEINARVVTIDGGNLVCGDHLSVEVPSDCEVYLQISTSPEVRGR